jgi:hypothetical protein
VDFVCETLGIMTITESRGSSNGGPIPVQADAQLVHNLLDPDPRVATGAFHAMSELATSPTRPVCAHAIRDLISCLEDASGLACARILLLLGVLAEPSDVQADPQSGVESELVASGLEMFLCVATRAGANRAVGLALAYLLGHFPQASDRILAAMDPAIEAEALSRLRRTLAAADYASPQTADLAGRCWPSPTVLAFTEQELASTSTARHALPPDAVRRSWDLDTRALIAYAGGYAASVITAES